MKDILQLPERRTAQEPGGAWSRELLRLVATPALVVAYLGAARKMCLGTRSLLWNGRATWYSSNLGRSVLQSCSCQGLTSPELLQCSSARSHLAVTELTGLLFLCFVFLDRLGPGTSSLFTSMTPTAPGSWISSNSAQPCGIWDIQPLAFKSKDWRLLHRLMGWCRWQKPTST